MATRNIRFWTDQQTIAGSATTTFTDPDAYTFLNSTAVCVDLEAVGIVTATGTVGDSAYMKRRAFFQISSGGTVTRVGAVLTIDTDLLAASINTVTATITNSGATPQVQVTTPASNTIRWFVKVTYTVCG